MTLKRNIFLYFKVRSREHKNSFIYQSVLCISLTKLSLIPLLGRSGTFFGSQASVLIVTLFCIPTHFILVSFPPESWEYISWLKVCVGFGPHWEYVPGHQRRATPSVLYWQEHSQGKEGSDYPPPHLLAHTGSTSSSFGPPDLGNILTNWNELRGGGTKVVRVLTGEMSLCLEVTGLVQLTEEAAYRGFNSGLPVSARMLLWRQAPHQGT